MGQLKKSKTIMSLRFGTITRVEVAEQMVLKAVSGTKSKVNMNNETYKKPERVRRVRYSVN